MKEEIQPPSTMSGSDTDLERMSTAQDRGIRNSFSAAELERLGRERPDAFQSIWVEIGFCFSLLGSMFTVEYFISGFNILLPTLSVALKIPSQAETWPASVPSLVTGALLLPMGRLSDMFGGYVVFVSGLVWFLIWSVIAGFSQNYLMLVFCRALQGLGPAAFLPAGIMLLGSTVSSLFVDWLCKLTLGSTVQDQERISSSVFMAPSLLSVSLWASSSLASARNISHGAGTFGSVLSYSLL